MQMKNLLVLFLIHQDATLNVYWSNSVSYAVVVAVCCGIGVVAVAWLADDDDDDPAFWEVDPDACDVDVDDVVVLVPVDGSFWPNADAVLIIVFGSGATAGNVTALADDVITEVPAVAAAAAAASFAACKAIS